MKIKDESYKLQTQKNYIFSMKPGILQAGGLTRAVRALIIGLLKKISGLSLYCSVVLWALKIGLQVAVQIIILQPFLQVGIEENNITNQHMSYILIDGYRLLMRILEAVFCTNLCSIFISMQHKKHLFHAFCQGRPPQASYQAPKILSSFIQINIHHLINIKA